jgi:hypothetical protein
MDLDDLLVISLSGSPAPENEGDASILLREARKARSPERRMLK